MTLILGVKTDKELVMGSDSCASTDSDYTILRESKVVQKGKLFIGCAGYLRMVDILKHDFHVDLKPEKMKDSEYIYRVVELLRTRLSELGFNEVNSEVHSMGNNWLLIAYNMQFYEINGNYGILCSASPYVAIGSGAFHGIAALDALSSYTNATPQTNIRNALQITSDYVQSVKPPFNIVSMKK